MQPSVALATEAHHIRRLADKLGGDADRQDMMHLRFINRHLGAAHLATMASGLEPLGLHAAALVLPHDIAVLLYPDGAVGYDEAPAEDADLEKPIFHFACR